MNDLISRQYLLDIFSKNSIFQKITNAEGKSVIDIIQDAPKATEWTPCAEKLPIDGVVYELSCRYLNQDYVTIGYCKAGKPDRSYIDDNSMFKHSEVIAWRKFGEPYNGE